MNQAAPAPSPQDAHAPAGDEIDLATAAKARVAFVQYGDFRAAAEGFARGEPETYFAQRYSVDEVEELADPLESVSVLTLKAEPYDMTLPSGVRVVGVAGAAHDPAGVQAVIEQLDRLDPDHLILRTPSVGLLEHTLAKGWRVLPLLADSFPRSWRGRWRSRRLTRLLRSASVPWVANHQRPASNDLVRLGVPPEKIIPWDWPPATTPNDWPVRSRISETPKLIYVGQLLEAKGLGDAIDAVGLLHKQGQAVELTVVGGEPGPWQAHAKRAGVADTVHFAGRVPHAKVLRMLAEHTAAIVPSRPGYPEGLPMTIFDALSTRTPLILSDHPMFQNAVKHGESGLFFRAADAADLAAQVARLLGDAALYTKLSDQAAQAWSTLRVPVRWHELVRRWVRNSEADGAWLAEHTLARLDRGVPR